MLSRLASLLPSFSLRAGSAALSFVVFVAAARMLGTESFGLFSVAFSAGLAGALFGLMGQTTLLMKDFDFEAPIAVRGPVLKGAVVSVACSAGLLLVTGVVVLGVGLWLNILYVQAVGVGLVLSAPYVVSDVLQTYWRARQMGSVALLPRDIFWRVLSIAVILLVGQELGFIGITLIMAFLLTLLCIAHAVLFWNDERGFWSTKSRINVKEVLYIQGVHAADAAYFFGDVLIIGALVGGHEVGLYAAAARIAAVLAIVQQSVDLISLPKIGLLINRGDRSGATATVRQNARLASSLCTVGGLFIMAASPLILLAFGPEYKEDLAVYVCIGILLMLQVIVAFCGHSATVLMYMGKASFAAGFSLAVAVTFVAVAIPATIHFGAIGLAAAKTGVYGIAAVMRALINAHLTGLSTFAVGGLRPMDPPPPPRLQTASAPHQQGEPA